MQKETLNSVFLALSRYVCWSIQSSDDEDGVHEITFLLVVCAFIVVIVVVVVVVDIVLGSL